MGIILVADKCDWCDKVAVYRELDLFVAEAELSDGGEELQHFACKDHLKELEEMLKERVHEI